jgi:hypothetical protein
MKNEKLKKATRIVLALVVLPLLVGPLIAATSFIGNLVNIGQFGGTNVSLGSKTSASSIPVVIASDQAGFPVTNLGTFAVQAAATLAAETTKIIGTINVAAGQSIAVTNTGTFAVQATLAAGSTVSGSSVAVVGMGRAFGVPVQTQVTATASSGALVAGNANRVGIEIDAACSNTQNVFINWGSVAATSAMKFIAPCSSWQPPVSSTVAIQVISASGSQVVNVIEYNNQ